MALAILATANSPGDPVLRFDIGKNRYYRYAIGSETQRNAHGIDVIDEPSFVSPLSGPVADSTLGRGDFELPRGVLDRENRLIQLMSFHSDRLDGPAISSVVRLQAHAPSGALPDLPELALAQDTNMQTQTSNHYVPIRPFHYSQSHLSDAMFLEAITSLLPKILPAVGNIVGGLFGGGGGRAAANPLETLLGAIGKPETLDQLTKLLESIAGGVAGGRTATPGTSPNQAQAQALARIYADATYSQAQFAPALLAALPALAPLLQQVLNPETIKNLLDAPNKHVGTLINGFKDVAKIGIESHEQDLRHLRELNPGVNDPALDALLAGLSAGVPDMASEITYKRVTSARLEFVDLVTTTLFGRSVTPYLAGRDLAFPVAVHLPKPIGKAIVDLVVKRADTLEIVHRERAHLQSVTSGPLKGVPGLPAAISAKLPPGSDYNVCVTLVWKNRDGRKRGTSIQQQFTLLGDYAFDRVEDSGQLLPLTDADRYRDYWHKIWEGRFTRDSKHLDVHVKYFYVLKPDTHENARLETLTREDDGERRRQLSLKSGMDLSAAALNRLSTRLDPTAKPLGDAEVAALARGAFAERVNQCARYNGKLRGRPGDTAAIWVYPEVKLQQVVLRRVTDTNANGNVTSLTEHPVRIPVPAIVHFIGVRSA